MSPEQHKLNEIRAAREFGIGPMRHESPPVSEVIECSLARSSGSFSDEFLLGEYGERTLEDSTSKFGLRDTIRAAVGIRSGRITDARISDALTASSGVSTIVLPEILSNLASKAALAAYSDLSGGALAISSTTSTKDFKKFTRYRMTESGIMEEVSANGEIKHGSLLEESYENQVKTYGRMLSMTRQMLRNDDLEMFLQIPRLLGRMGRHALEQAVIGLLIDSTWTTLASSGPPLLDSLGNAVEIFENLTDADGKPVAIQPNKLLTCNGDFIKARKLFRDDEYRFTSTDRSETVNNQFQGMFEPIKSGYLHRLGTSPSSKQWFLLSVGQDAAPIQIAFLDGRQTPTINFEEVNHRNLAVSFRGIFDFGVAQMDDRCVVKADGVTP